MIIRFVVALALIFSLSGCASMNQFLSKIEDAWENMVNNKDDTHMTYADIVDTQNVRKTASEDEGYRFVRPVVQKMKIPNMIRGGILIPTHEEYVIVTDAAYVANDGISDEIRRRYRVPAGVELVSPLKGTDVIVGVFRMNKVFSESTLTPISKVSFLLEGKTMDRVFALLNDELAQVGTYLCSFNREKGQDFITVSVVENGLKNIKTYSVSKSQMLFLSNGYALIPLFDKKGDT